MKGNLMPKNGQYQISLSKLMKLDAEVEDKDRIEVAR